MVLGPHPEVDTNFAAVLLRNGSLAGLLRRYFRGNGSRLHLVTARDWRVAESYEVRD